MDEAEWLAATEPRQILTYLANHLTQHRLRCTVLECCRVLQPICGNGTTQRMLQVAEKINASNEMDSEVVQLRYETRNAMLITENHDANCAYQYLLSDDLSPGMVEFAVRSTHVVVSDEFTQHSNRHTTSYDPGTLLRDIFGNPFRPVAFDPAWLSETAVALATGIYAERAFDRLPILADALEEAGCDHAEVLSHCRGPGPHVRGCWVVDLVLGKG